MLYVNTGNSHDPSLNLAAEEYVIRHIAPEEEILLFYINGPSIIIGRNQNTIQEINTDYVEANNIKVVRRLSGGGAVYHDEGNLNFSFIAPHSKDNFHNFKKFTEPVIKVLNNMGVLAELRGRNDIVVNDQKISGNAQYVAGERMVSHGTLLWQADLGRVGEALRVKAAKIESKGIKSIRSRVANITEFIEGEPMSVEAFREHIIESVFEGKEIKSYQLTASDWEAVEKLADERYRNWDWNYGRSPAFDIQRETRYAGGEIEVYLDVAQGEIKDIKFYGDFFGQRGVDELETLLVGTRYAPESLAKALEKVTISDYFVNYSLEELIALLY
jgi:lipoate-protein ligase A